MTPDYRALCAELVDALAEWRLGGGPPEDTADADLIARARTLLDQPAAESPADGEVAELQRWGVDHGAQPGRPLLSPMEDGYWTPWHIAADLLQRQHPQPVAVSERLPGPEDCDVQGRCWLWERDCGYSGCKWAESRWIAAAALRAAADQVVPEEPLYGGDQRWMWERDARQACRKKLLAIAAELGGE
jgi:hypothetical protein